MNLEATRIFSFVSPILSRLSGRAVVAQFSVPGRYQINTPETVKGPLAEMGKRPILEIPEPGRERPWEQGLR